MRKLALVAAIFLFPIGAFAQSLVPGGPVTYTITVDVKQLDLIGKGIGAMPYNEAAPLVQSLQRQINEQNEAARKAAQPVPPAVAPVQPEAPK